MAPCRILLVSGSLRAGSTNSALLATAASLDVPGVETSSFAAMGALPHFNPDDDFDPLPEPVVALRRAIGDCDAVLFCTPEYAGALPGSFKNLLEWTVGGPEMYERSVAWVNASGVASPTGAADAHASLRKVLGYIHAVPLETACARIPIARSTIGADGLIADAEVRTQLRAVLEEIARCVESRPPREIS